MYIRCTDQLLQLSTSQSNINISQPASKKKSTSPLPLPYSDQEIHLSEGIDREKRIYWNKRVQNFTQDLHEKRRTRHEVYGIIDVEWVQKKSDFPKVTYDKAIRNLEENHVEYSLGQTSSSANTKSKFVCQEMELIQKYEELCKAEFELKACYKNIEVLHSKKSEEESIQWSKKRDELEIAFNKQFTKLKQQQAALQKSLQVEDNKAKTTGLSNSMPSTNSTVSDLNAYANAAIEAEDMQKIANNIKSNYLVEDMSESD